MSLDTSSLHGTEDPEMRHRLPRWYSRLLGLLVLAVIVHEVGFTGGVTPLMRWATALLVLLFAAEHAAGLWRAARPADYARAWAVHVWLAAALLPLMAAALLGAGWLRAHDEKLTLLLYGLIQGGMLASLGLRFLRRQAQVARLNLRPGWIFMGSFALLVAGGALLLKLPRAVEPGHTLSWLDALFTSTSAVCVTGLAVVSTADFFSPTGQVILLGLIQMGGLGIMTLTYFLTTLLFRGMSLHDRQVLGEMISEKHLSHVAGSVRFIVGFTFAAELLGAALLYHALPEDRGLAERAFQAVFHSVSAFCNAGFSTLPAGLADTWTRDNAALQLIICALVISGGLGAMVARDALAWARARLRLARHPAGPRPRLKIHTRLVLALTAGLVIAGAVLVYLGEFVLTDGQSNGGAWLTALFHSVTARTAGFNTTDTGAIGPVTVHILVMLMLIGGSPGGTAGGVRTTVFAVACPPVSARAPSPCSCSPWAGCLPASPSSASSSPAWMTPASSSSSSAPSPPSASA